MGEDIRQTEELEYDKRDIRSQHLENFLWFSCPVACTGCN